MILLLSGPSGSGKSAACALVYYRLSAAGTTVGGVRCAAVFESGIKTGIDAVLLGTSQPGMPLARMRAGFDPAILQARPASDRSRLRVPLFDHGNPSRFSFGMWDFDAAVLGIVDASVASWLERPPTGFPTGQSGRRPVAIIDEIGPLELEHGLGFIRTLTALDAVAAGSGTETPVCVVTSRPEAAIALKQRWPSATVVEPSPAGGFSVADILDSVKAAG